MFFKVLQINQLIELCSRKCRWHLSLLCFHSANQVPLHKLGLCWGWQFASRGTNMGCGANSQQGTTTQTTLRMKAEMVCGDVGKGTEVAPYGPSYHLFHVGSRVVGLICLFRVA